MKREFEVANRQKMNERMVPVKREQKEAGLDASTERLLCTGLVVSERVLKELAPIYRPELMCADFTRWVADKCLEFYLQHGAAPKRHMEDIFRSARRSGLDSDLADLIGNFLGGISGEYEREDKFNEGYVVDQALHYFRGRSLWIASEDSRAMLGAGRLEEAEERWAQFKRIERPCGEGTNPFIDPDLIKRAFERQERPLFTLPGAAGTLFNIQAHRQNFVSFLGVVGRGKTFTLQEVTKYALRGRCNTAFIGVGDMSEEEYTLRWAVNLAGRSEDLYDCEAGWIPALDCVKNQENSCVLSCRSCAFGLPEEIRTAKEPHPDDTPKNYLPCQVCQHKRNFQGAGWWSWRDAVKPLTWPEALRQGERFARRMKGKNFKLKCYPSRGISPRGIDGLLSRWRDYEGWIPDVLVVDYLDEVGPDEKFDQFRQQEAQKWSAMRGLAQTWNLFLCTAEQSDAGGYDKETLTMKNFNEDRRRNDVVTGKMTINQTPEEKRRGLARWAWAKLRKGHYTLHDQVYTVQSLGQGRPLVGSWWRRD